MKPSLTLALFLCFFLHYNLYSQLSDGDTAPDWTETDINGNVHHLYDYLDQGKMVVIEFSATWCGPCWNYMMSGALEAFWDEHGPNGLNDAMVFYIEADWNTDMDDLLGLTNESQGNWVAEIPFPIIDLQFGDNLANEYDINYYPTLYATCHDYTLYELGQVSSQAWSDFVESCNLEVSEGVIEPAYCAGEGSASVDVTGGFEPYSYHWSNGAHTQTITGLNGGDYSVTVTEDNGKISHLDIYVPGVDEPIFISDASIEPVLCNGSSNGSIEIDVDGGIPGYQYDWSNGSSSQDLHNIPADNYTVTVTDNSGCTVVESYVVDEPDVLEAEVETTTEDCDMANGSITLDISGGTGDYDVTASEGNVFGNQVLDLSAGNVDVEIEDENGCIWSDVVNIEYISAPFVEVTDGAQVNCIQTTASVSGFASGGNGEFDFLWTTTDGHIVSNPLSSTITVDEPGSYHLKVTDIESGCETQETASVASGIVLPDVDAGPVIPINCENLQVTLAATGDTLNSINWTTVNGNILEGGSTYHPIINAPGTYYIDVTNSATNCTNQDSVLIPDESAPAAAQYQFQTSGLTMIGTDLSTGSNLSGWNWSFGDGNTSTETNVVHTFSTAGTYNVCLSVQNGCGVNQTCQSIEVTFTGSVILVDAVVTNVSCYGESTGSIILTVNGGSGVYTYAWTGPDTTYTTNSIENVPAGGYQLVVSDDSGNIYLGGFTIVQPPALNLESSAIVDNLCYGETNGSITLNVSGGVPPYLYSWNGSPPQPENFVAQLPGGIVNAEVIDSNGCVILAGPYTISEPAQITPQLQIVNPLCHGDANGSISLTINGGVSPYSYLWSSNGSQESSITGLTAGNYPAVVTDANGCDILLDIPLSEPDILEPKSITITNASGPEQNNGAITLEVIGGTAPYHVAWSNGDTGISINGLLPGEYNYVITDTNGCQYASPVPVIVNFSTSTIETKWPDYVTITPNPTKGQVAIQWSELPFTDATLSVMTVDGKLVDSRKMTSSTGKWDLTPLNLSNGLYIILLKQNHEVYPFKLIVL